MFTGSIKIEFTQTYMNCNSPGQNKKTEVKCFLSVVGHPSANWSLRTIPGTYMVLDENSDK